MSFRVLIVRLSPFPETVKSVTHQFLYGECRRVLPDDDIDFAFFPTETDRKRHTPFCGMKTRLPAKEFNLILIANSFTCELLNLPYLLKLAGIPYTGSERHFSCNSNSSLAENSVSSTDCHTGARSSSTATSSQSACPLIIMGGSNALAAQSVLFSEDDALIDALYFGEGERNVEKIVRALSTSDTPWQTLASLQGTIEGLKVFGAQRFSSTKENSTANSRTIVRKAINNDTSTELLARAEQRLFDSPEATTARLFMAYGCPAFCTFCFEGWEHKPYREVPVSQLLEAAQELRTKTGTDTLEITAYNFNTYSDITPLFRELNKLFFQVNFMSQRADILAAHPELVLYEVSSGKKQYTLGIEGISERMRSYYNKNLSEQTALSCITQLLKQPIREIKLFYIISGLETEDDNADYKQFLSKIAELKETYNNGIRILCSFGLLVRMPFTPLQYEKLLLTKEEWSPVVSMIRETTENAGYEFRLTYPYEEYFLSQTLALYSPLAKICDQNTQPKIERSVNGNYLAPILCDMAEHNYIYNQGVAPEAWNYFCSQYSARYNGESLLSKSFTEQKKDSYHFAFDYLAIKTPSAVLYQRYRNANALFATNESKEIIPSSYETPMCLGAKCTGCGACSSEQRKTLEQHKLIMPNENDRTEIATLTKEKAQAQPVYIEVDVNDSLFKESDTVTTIRAHQETKDAALMRQLFANIPNATSLIMTVRDSLFGSKLFDGKLPRWSGKTMYAVFPFSNKMRSTLYNALVDAGYVVYQQQYIPEIITIELKDPESISQKEITFEQKSLEKTAASLLDNMHMQYTLSRIKSDSSTTNAATMKSNYTITPKCLKKHIVTSCTIESGTIKITGSSKIDLSSISRSGLTALISFISANQSFSDDNAA